MAKHKISDRIESCWSSLTTTDKKAARILLADYPIAGLGTLAEVSETAEISSPSVIRFVKKLGFSGYPEFQRELHAEIALLLKNQCTKLPAETPRSLPDRIGQQRDFLLDAVNSTFDQLQASEVRNMARLLAGSESQVIVMGGFSTSSMAQALYRRLIALRPNCELLGSDPLVRSERLIDLNRSSTLLVLDLSPHDPDIESFVRLVSERGINVSVITDDHASATCRKAHHVLVAAKGEDAGISQISAACLVEVLLKEVAHHIGQPAHDRLRQLEAART